LKNPKVNSPDFGMTAQKFAHTRYKIDDLASSKLLNQFFERSWCKSCCYMNRSISYNWILSFDSSIGWPAINIVMLHHPPMRSTLSYEEYTLLWGVHSPMRSTPSYGEYTILWGVHPPMRSTLTSSLQYSTVRRTAWLKIVKQLSGIIKYTLYCLTIE